MKRFSLIVILFLLLVGCSKKDISHVVVMDNVVNDDGLVLLCDDKYDVINKIKIEYPNNAFFQDNQIYVLTTDYFQGYNINSGKQTNKINTNDLLLGICENSSYFTYNNVSLVLQDKNDEMISSIEIGIIDYLVKNNQLYVIDSIGTLYVYSLNDGSQIQKSYLNFTNDTLFTTIDNDVYFVNRKGITKIVDGLEERTYLFNLDVDYVYDVTDNIVSFMIDNTIIAYELSFNNYQVEMMMITDEEFYSAIDYEEIFKKYYEDGFSSVYDFEVK